MRLKLACALALIATGANADIASIPSACAVTGSTWTFQEIIVSVVESTSKTVPVFNNAEPQILMHTCFFSAADCQAARNALNIFGTSVPLGTGGGATAHVGRTVSECQPRGGGESGR